MDKNQELPKYIIAKKKRKYIRKNRSNQVKEIPNKPEKPKFKIEVERNVIIEY